MKYLVILTPNQTPLPLDMAEKLYRAAIAWTEERLKNGKMETTYIFNEKGGFSVANVNSQEELFDEMLSYPLYPFFDWEITPLVEWRHGYNSVIESYKKMVAK